MAVERVVAQIARHLLTTCPPGWDAAQVVCRRAGAHVEVRAHARQGSETVVLPVLDPVAPLFVELRVTGPLWFSARVRLVPPDHFTLDTDDGEPTWSAPLGWRAICADPALRAVRREAELPAWVRAARAAQAIEPQLRASLVGAGLGAGDVALADAPGPGWRVVRRGAEWVAQHEGTDLSGPSAHVRDAAALALGHALLDVVRAEGRIVPRADDPPFSAWTSVRPVVLAVGLELDRYGDGAGSVTYRAATPWPLRSLPDTHAARPYAAYTVARPIEALVGTTVAWFGRPGGGTVFVLPLPVADLVAAGALIRTV